MGYDFAYAMENAMSSMGLSLLMNAGSSLLNIAVYVFTSLSLYTIAKRRQISKPWMAWIPVVNCWILGSISDQYRYVARGETRNKRKLLLILNIISGVLLVAMLVMLFVMTFNMVQNVIMFTMDEEELLTHVMKSLGGMMALILPIVGVSIAYAVIFYLALYDVYASCDPGNKAVYLILTILFGGLLQAIFLFISRNKDGGMPPRRDLPPAAGQPYQAAQPQYQGQPQYQTQYQQPQYQPYQAPQYQQPEQIHATEELHRPQPEEVPPMYSQWPDPSAPQHPQEDTPEQL